MDGMEGYWPFVPVLVGFVNVASSVKGRCKMKQWASGRMSSDVFGRLAQSTDRRLLACSIGSSTSVAQVSVTTFAWSGS
jgi:hypothetical protein